MTETDASRRHYPRREWWLVGAFLVVAILFRAAPFVIWEETQFDADQAVMGLMAKHISEGRAFPVFFYGSNHILAVQAWLAAPVFLVGGVSVGMLKVPLVAINLAVALLLLRLFVRECGLRPRLALFPILFFALAAPGTTASLLEPGGGNVEPMLYVLLFWLTWRRPALCGVVFAIAFMHREFTLHGLIALVVIRAVRGDFYGRVRSGLITRQVLWHRLAMVRTAAEVWLLAQVLRYASPAAGPGTTILDVASPHNNLTEVANRICMDLTIMPARLWLMFTDHWPMLFGIRRQPMLDFAIDSELPQGAAYGGFVLAAAMLLAVGGIVYRLAVERRWRRDYDFAAYLTLTGLLSTAGYVAARCDLLVLLRYELLSLIGAVGLGAWFLRAQPAGWVRNVWLGLVCACALITTSASTALLIDNIRHPRVGAKRLVARHLEARGIRYGSSDYWLAYSITFLTNERIVLASEDVNRIATYWRLVREHPEEAVRISRVACDGGRRAGEVWICPLP